MKIDHGQSMKALSDEELINVIGHYKEYTDEMLSAVVQEIEKRKIKSKVKRAIAENQIQARKQQEALDEKRREQSQYNPDNEIIIKPGTALYLNFVRRLDEEKIKAINTERIFPLSSGISYYFKDADFSKALEIYNEIISINLPVNNPGLIDKTVRAKKMKILSLVMLIISIFVFISRFFK